MEGLNGVLVEFVENIDDTSFLDLTIVSVMELSIVLALDTGAVETGCVGVDHEVPVEAVTEVTAEAGFVRDHTSIRSWAGALSLRAGDPSGDALQASWRSVGLDPGPLALGVMGGDGAPSVSVWVVTVLADGTVGDSVRVEGADAVGWDVASAEAPSGLEVESVSVIGLTPGALVDFLGLVVVDVAAVGFLSSTDVVWDELFLEATAALPQAIAGKAAVAATEGWRGAMRVGAEGFVGVGAGKGGVGKEGDSDELDEFVHF